jgi:hypothetical protein
MPKYGQDVARLIEDGTGREIVPGEKFTTRVRGHEAVFLYISRLPEDGKTGRVFTDVRPGGEFFPSVFSARIEVAERFRFHTPETVDGILHIEALSDAQVLQISRDKERTSPALRAVKAWMTHGEGEINQGWIVSQAARVAYHRGLITGEEFDLITA